VAVNSIYVSTILSYKYNLVLKSFSYGTQVMGHPVYEYSVRQCEVTYRKYALKQGNRIGVRFITYDIQDVFLKCAEILPTRLWNNVED
jgi:hypothetical protein